MRPQSEHQDRRAEQQHIPIVPFEREYFRVPIERGQLELEHPRFIIVDAEDELDGAAMPAVPSPHGKN